MNSYTVSTECPSCSAPLDFSEGSNAVQCLHCGSKLFVTGRKQVLSYFIHPKVDHYRAIAAAMKAHEEQGRECRVIKPRIYFIPYYRMIGSDFRWEEAPPVKLKPEIEYGQPDAYSSDYGRDYEDEGLDLGSVFRNAGVLMDLIFGDGQQVNHTRASGQVSDPFVKNMVRVPEEEVPDKFQLADRYVEKNFIACNLHGQGLYSLGLRPAVLRLELFEKAIIEPLGKVVSPDLGIEQAFGSAMKDASLNPLLFRSVLGRILSIIYFPFWVIEMEHEDSGISTVVDAVSQSVVKLDAPPSIYEILNQPPGSDQNVAGFRPLSCPNCGWDLPLRPDDAIFFCSSCGRAWQICGSDLTEIDYRIAGTDGIEGPVKHLPFWVLEIKVGDGLKKFFIPAFRFRRLKMLADLAAGITRKGPAYSLMNKDGGEVKEMQGCYYDAEDAFLLAQFVQAGISSKTSGDISSFRKDDLSLSSATLTWFPFKVNGCNLVDPFTGISIPQALLL